MIMMKKINKVLVVLSIATVICWLGFYGLKTVSAAEMKFSCVEEDKNKDDSKAEVRLHLNGSHNIRNYTAYVSYEYESIDGNDWFEKEKSIEFKKTSTGKWKSKSTLKLNRVGTYTLHVHFASDDDSFDTNVVKITVGTSKPVFALQKEDSSIELNNNDYTKFYHFFGNPKIEGNTYYYKGTSAQIGAIVYEGVSAAYNMQCIIAGRTYDAGEYDKNSGYIGRLFTISGETEGEVSFVATNKNGEKATKSTGKKIVIDNTKPVVKIDSAYSSNKKTVYRKKSISVAIIITEKYFDTKNTKVLVNGKNVSVDWQSNGSKNTAKVKLSKGENTISVVGADKAGNTSKSVKSTKIIIDTTAPVVKISSDVENGKSYGNRNGQYTNYSINVEISDKYLGDKQNVILYRINGATNKYLEKTELTGSGNGEDCNFKLDDITEDGYYKLVVSVSDRAGNKVTDKSLKKQGKYEVRNGKAIGYFYINRNGSKYEIDESSKQYYESAVNEIGDVIIYEYNINSIKKENQQVSLITTLGEKRLNVDSNYAWQDVSTEKRDDTYQYVYKYTIKPENFSEGLYSIKIVSSADVIGDKNSSLKVEASNDIIMNQVVNVDKKNPEIISMEKDGSDILIHIRDENFDVNSAELKINGEVAKLELDKNLTTSTNIYYTGTWNGSVDDATFSCNDLAGNETTYTNMQVYEKGNSIVWFIIGLVAGAIVLIVIR